MNTSFFAKAVVTLGICAVPFLVAAESSARPNSPANPTPNAVEANPKSEDGAGPEKRCKGADSECTEDGQCCSKTCATNCTRHGQSVYCCTG